MPAVISSRTPEGRPCSCPICGHYAWLEPSLTTDDAPCPRCGHLLWFDPAPVFSRAARAAEKVAARTIRSLVVSRVWMEGLTSLVAGVCRVLKPRRPSTRPTVSAGSQSGVWDPWLDGPGGTPEPVGAGATD